MEIIVNPKVSPSGINIIQLETAVGAAMKSFERSIGMYLFIYLLIHIYSDEYIYTIIYLFSIGIHVPRSRFLPVKKTSDLLLVKSNLYDLKNGSLIMSPKRMFPVTPLIKLGDNHFSKVN